MSRRVVGWVICAGVVGAMVATTLLLASNNLLPRRVAFHLLAAAALATTRRAKGSTSALCCVLLANVVGVWALSAQREAGMPGLADALAAIGLVLGLRTHFVRRNFLLQVVVATCLGGALAGLAEQWLPIQLGDATRPAGFFASRVTAATMMAAALPLTWLVLLRHRKLFALSIALEAAFLISTRTRVAWVAGTFAFAVLALAVPRCRKPLLAGGLGAFALASLLTPGPLVHWSSSTPYSDSLKAVVALDIGNRLDVWAETLRLIVVRPWGYGAGTFEASFAAAAGALPPALADVRIESPHNEALRLAYELGLPGVALLFVALWPRKRRAGARTRSMQLSLVTLFICSMTGKTLADPPTLVLVAILLGILLRSVWPAERQRSRSFNWVRGTLCLGLVILIGAVDLPALRASKALADGRRFAARGELRRALETAVPHLEANRDLGSWLWAIDVMTEAGDTPRCSATCSAALKMFPNHPALVSRHLRCGE